MGRCCVRPPNTTPRPPSRSPSLVEVGPGGELVSWTWVDPPRSQSPWGQPHGLGMIRLDGADTAMVHGLLVERPEAELSVGMRVTAHWRPEREGHIADLEGFVPEGTDQ